MARAPEVQQCYAVAGEWDYAVMLVARDLAHCHELGNLLFKDAPNVKRYVTLPVFNAVKTGAYIPLP
ncbi:Lrp/AsnC family transcriptional regulator [Bailinhaonella thermotolerans]|uniref:Lrp/AsnC family transcriptional regulator n=1 Tax=Bailinhaonella thermotolerans TaxID=1070861 RepID=A0A3A4ANV8_9ACTN|nr:Lrp/AsnC family transcriptional regulator [Bailinhaonella thermotolerans]RJL23018.1 Lrp/AsnC family transcriptional regulator [Bailinhaonella thermotolerans]